MRKVIVSEFVTLDGVTEDPRGAEGFEHGGWSIRLDSEEQELFKTDAYRQMVFPIVVGKGKRLFGDVGERRALRLVYTKPVGPDGVLVLTYRPVGEEQGALRERWRGPRCREARESPPGHGEEGMDERGGTRPMNPRTILPARRASQEVREKGRQRIGGFMDHPLDEEVL